MDSLILEKDNSEKQARQYSSHKHVANIEWRANHKKKKKMSLKGHENSWESEVTHEKNCEIVISLREVTHGAVKEITHGALKVTCRAVKSLMRHWSYSCDSEVTPWSHLWGSEGHKCIFGVIKSHLDIEGYVKVLFKGYCCTCYVMLSLLSSCSVGRDEGIEAESNDTDRPRQCVSYTHLLFFSNLHCCL